MNHAAKFRLDHSTGQPACHCQESEMKECAYYDEVSIPSAMCRHSLNAAEKGKPSEITDDCYHPDVRAAARAEYDHGLKLEEAKRVAAQMPRKVAWVVTWPAGHTTVETSPVLMKCNRTKVVEVSAAGQLTCA